MQIISAAEFKAKCLKLMDIVAMSHEEIIITKRGKPIARIVPVESGQSPFGFLKSAITVKGNIVDPIRDEVWEADS